MPQTIENRINKIIKNVVGKKEDNITMSSDLKDDLNCDSLDELELIMELEEEFNIDIEDNEAEQVIRVKDVYDLINKKLEELRAVKLKGKPQRA